MVTEMFFVSNWIQRLNWIFKKMHQSLIMIMIENIPTFHNIYDFFRIWAPMNRFPNLWRTTNSNLDLLKVEFCQWKNHLTIFFFILLSQPLSLFRFLSRSLCDSSSLFLVCLFQVYVRNRSSFHSHGGGDPSANARARRMGRRRWDLCSRCDICEIRGWNVSVIIPCTQEFYASF